MADAPTAQLAYGRTELDDHDHLPTSTGLLNEKLTMWAFLGSECLLFGALISVYLLVRNVPDELEGVGVKISEAFDIPFTSVSAFVLLMSSLTMVLAVQAIAQGDDKQTRLWLMTTGLFGTIFLAGQVYEFTIFYNEGFGYTTNISTSAFYTLTGFHGVHVTVGILMLMSLWVAANQGKLTSKNAETVEIVGLYWHFVDIVWIFIFTVIYLIPPA